MRRARWALLVAVLALLAGIAVVVALGGTDRGATTALPGSAPPPEAQAAVTSLFSGDRDRIARAVTPSLAALLAPEQRPSTVEVELVDWVERDAFAGATAILRAPDGETRMDVGFRRVDGAWRITYAQVTG